MSNGVKLANPPKALIVLVALVCLTILLLFEKIDPVAGFGLLGAVTGYAIGNGVAAAQGDPIRPIFDQRDPHRRAADSRSDD